MAPLANSLLVLAALVSAAAGNDIGTLHSEAERAYLRGDLAAAKEKFGLILRLDPAHRTAGFYMKRILADEKAQLAKLPPGAATQAALARVVLSKVDIKDATLAEALEFLRQKGNQAAEGRVAINFVQQLDDAAKAAKVTLTLNNAPYTEVLRYVGDLANVQFIYDTYAIVVKPKGGGVQQPPSGNPQDGGVKIQGL